MPEPLPAGACVISATHDPPDLRTASPVHGDGRPFPGRFGRLPVTLDPPPVAGALAPLLAEATAAAFRDVRLLRQSSWSELVPALFALFALLRPRRFVELGTHHGMSYFAACQATGDLGTKTECIAIDNWRGDAHAGLYGSDVFDGFAATLREAFPHQLCIRADFTDALRFFDDASIDLLHIDGFHTYEAVRGDFEAWLPKMSARGVIILHDIEVRDRDFGVWRLWEEIRGRYPSIGLTHSHGLGIVQVGAGPSVLADLLRLAAADPARARLAAAFFRDLGRVSIDRRRLQQPAGVPRPAPPAAGPDGPDVLSPTERKLLGSYRTMRKATQRWVDRLRGKR